MAIGSMILQKILFADFIIDKNKAVKKSKSRKNSLRRVSFDFANFGIFPNSLLLR